MNAVTPGRPDIVALTGENVPDAAAFLHRHLNGRVSVDAWSALMSPPWGAVGPNRGFALVTREGMAGVYAAVYSRRAWDEEQVLMCNLAAFCVLEEYRPHSLRLVRALLGQKGVVFTDLSPSGNVPAMNERLGFGYLDTSTRVVANLPALRGSRWHVSADERVITGTVRGDDARVHHDHRAAPAAHHLVVTARDRYAYMVFRRDRRKHVPGFATPLYVGGDRRLLETAWRGVGAHLLRMGMPMTLAEHRVLGFTPPGWGRDLPRPRPKMYRPVGVEQSRIDYLYSELTLLEW